MSSTLVDLLASVRARQPDDAAIERGSESLSYDALFTRAGGLAAGLSRAGVGVEDRVAVQASDPLDFVLGIVGACLAGAAYVPLDPDHPESRLARIVEDAAPAAALTDDAHRGFFEARGVPTLPIDGRAHEPHTGVAPLEGNAAYVVFTSGSTGRPKGVEVPHAGIVNTVRWSGQAFGCARGTRLANLLGWSFDASVQAFWEPLVHGATLCLFDPALRSDPRALARWLRDARVTSLYTTPALWRPLLELAPDDLTGLETVVCGGEAMRWSGFADAPVRTFNAYGPTEASVTATAARVVPGEPPSIGVPIDGARAYVLEDVGDLSEAAAGELVLGGRGVARGYVGAPRITAERFRPDARAEAPGARVYSTGDRVTRGEDGALAFVGRLDRQVKVAGHRVELGEVEAALRALEGVREAAVIARPDELGNRLVGFVVGALDAEAVRDGARARVPEPMVPGRVVVLDALPRHPSGKLDYGALSAHAEQAPAALEPGDPAWSEEERLLCRLYEEVLGVSRVTPADDFIGVGGDSVRVMKLVPMVEAAGMKIEFRDVIALPIRELATRLRQRGADRESSETRGISLAHLDGDAMDALLEDD